MAVNVATLTARLEADIRDFDRDMRKANRHLGKMDDNAKKANRGLSLLKTGMALVVTGVALGKLFQIGKEMTMLAVNAEAAGSAFKTTFGPAVHKAQRFVDEFANKAGLADFELQQLLTTTGNIVQGLGATEDASFDLSEQMATLAGDVASFSNAAGGAPAVLKALQSALTGEREALKTYGIVVSETDVVERALLMTHKENKDELTKLDKAYATMELATERAGKAVGRLDRAQDTAADSMRRFNAKLTEMKSRVGKTLVPILSDLLEVGEDLIPVIEGVAQGVANFITLTVNVVKGAGSVVKWFEDIGKAVKDVERHGGTQFWANLADILLPGRTGGSELYDLPAAIDQGKEGAEAYAASLLEAEEAVEALSTTEQRETMFLERVTRERYNYVEANESAALSTDGLREAMRIAAGTASTMAGAVSSVAGAVRGYAAALREQSDPVFAALAAAKRLEDAQADAETSALDLGVAALDYVAAFAAVDEQSITAATDALTISLDLAHEAAAQILVDAGLIDGIKASARFEVSFEGLTAERAEAIRRAYTPPSAVLRKALAHEFQMGGVVPGPIGRPQLAVVHGGEEVRTPEQQQAGSNVVVNQYITDDFKDPGAARRIVRELARELEDYYQETAR